MSTAYDCWYLIEYQGWGMLHCVDIPPLVVSIGDKALVPTGVPTLVEQDKKCICEHLRMNSPQVAAEEGLVAE